MALNARLRGVMDWLLEGYPAGVPPKDYIPLVALLRRRLSDDEIREITPGLWFGYSWRRDTAPPTLLLTFALT